MTRHRLCRMTALAMTAALTAGCPCGPYTHTEQLKQLEQLRRENRRLADDLDEARRQIDALAEQIEWGYELTAAQRAEVITVAGIRLGRFTGGLDLDGERGDDGVKVYLEPVDADGSVLKAAGRLEVELFDLALEEGDRRIGRWQLAPAQLRTHWSSSFLGAHYGVSLPWQAGPPAHEHLTVRVKFTDLLTGRSFAGQTDFDVSLPAPASRPATAPTTRPAAPT